jgi:translation initiation factor IF-1
MPIKKPIKKNNTNKKPVNRGNTPYQPRKFIPRPSTEDGIIFEGKVVEAYPGTTFGVQVMRKEGMEPLLFKCNLKSMMIKKRIMIIRGDTVFIEVNMGDMGDPDNLKGTIVSRV